jgi:hypothetical protein
MLRHIAVENLDKISHVNGFVDDSNILTQRCRTITNLDINPSTGDLSGMAALTAVLSMRILMGDYGTSNLNAVLTGIVPSLTDLNLFTTTHVILHDIATLCPSLENPSLCY